MIYVFGDYELDTQLYELRRAARLTKLEPKVFDVLAYLIQHRDRVVMRQELLEQLWPKQFIGEAVLSYCIMAARKAVGDSGRSQRIIKTLHGRGFRFVASVEERGPDAPGSEERSAPDPSRSLNRQALEGEATGASAVSWVDTGPTSCHALAGERKLVTVLCGTLVNAAAIAEHAGFAELQRLRQACFALAQREVERYEGTLQAFGEDRFLAFFGAPVAHEDHARRAVLAASGLQRRLWELRVACGSPQGVAWAVRMGVHTAPVLVGGLSDHPGMYSAAVGEVTNLAARLEEVAEPGQIVISEATCRLVADHCSLRPVEKFFRKDQTEPMPAWEVVSVREACLRFETEATRGLTPFVGRDRELQLLSDRFAQVQAGHGQAVFIMAEPGIGKSRLLFEFHRQLGDANAIWLEGHCLSFGQTIAFHPLIDLLKRQFQIKPHEAEGMVKEKITRGVLSLGHDLHPVLPYLFCLLAVEPGDPAVRSMDPQLRRGEIFNALRRLVLRAAQVRPQVLVFENLHWIDKATETFLSLLVDSIPTTRILCLFSYRPGYAHPLGDRTYYTRIALTTLSTADSVRMAQAMLATTSLPAELEALLVQKAEGNPFFVEEIIKSLADVGVLQRVGQRYLLAKPLDEIAVPDTIQGVLLARIDRLEEAPKRLLQIASVIGREFTRRLLDRIAGHQEQREACLQALKATELIYEKSLHPEVLYVFKHSLTHEVAYHSLLLQQRREVHRRIGSAVEELYADRLAEQYGVLAYHFMAGEEWTKALAYLCRAAEQAAQAFAAREAVALYDRALEAAHKLGKTVDASTLMPIYRAKANLHLVLSDFERALDAGERLLVLARRTGDRASEGAALESMALASRYAHDLDRALAYARQAIAVAGQAEATSVISGSYLVTGSVHYLTGRLQQARTDIDVALRISRSMGDVTRQSLALYAAGLLSNWEGNYHEASRLHAECLLLARAHSLLPSLVRCCFGYGVTLTGQGEYDAALAVFEEGLALTEKVGDELYYCRILNSLGWLYFELGNFDYALDLNRRSAEGARKRGHHETLANAELNLGDLFLAKGDLPLAREFLTGVHRLVKNPAISDRMQWRYSTHLFASVGEFWLARGGLARALEYADRCLQMATRTNARKYVIRAWRLKGEIALARGQWGDAESALRQALTIAKTLRNPTQCWRTYLALGQLYTETKRAKAAGQAYDAARQVISGITANLRDPRLRASLERAPLGSVAHCGF